MACGPPFGHFGRFPPAFWGSRGHLGVQNGPKMAPQGAKKGLKGPPFWAHYGPPNGLGRPKMQGETGQTGPKGGQQAITMCFETVLDHLDTILVHFQPKLKIEKILRF